MLVSFTGYERLSLKTLNNVMRHREAGEMAIKWFDLGVELLDGDTSKLDFIEKQYHNQEERCCRMFKTWLERKPDASWSQLVTALKNINLYQAADYVSDNKLSEEGLYIVCMQSTLIYSICMANE